MEQEVLAKAKAAVAWCKSASETGTQWEYLFVPEDIFKQFNDTTIESLSRACTPELTRLLQDAERQTLSLPFYQISEVEKQAQREISLEKKISIFYPKTINGLYWTPRNFLAFYKPKTNLLLLALHRFLVRLTMPQLN